MGNTIIKLIKQDNLNKLIKDTNSSLLNNRTPSDSDRSFYLGHLAQDRKYFKEILKYTMPNYGSFSKLEKKIHSTMNVITSASDVAEVSIFIYL